MSKKEEMKKFTKEEMGVFKGSQVARLPQEFIRKHLPLGVIHWKKLPFKTDIQCPFCKEGVLTLTEVKKDICEVHVCHTGDSYNFWCSNKKECIALFYYTNQWLYC